MDNTSTLLKLLESIHDHTDQRLDELLDQITAQDCTTPEPPDHLIQYLVNYSMAVEAIESRQAGLIFLNRN